MGTRSFHVCADIRGMLRWDGRKLNGALLRDDGSKMSADEVREVLYDCLAKGWKVLPVGNPCEGFSYETGCPGHPAHDATKQEPSHE